MNIESIGAATTTKPRANEPTEEVVTNRQAAQDNPQQASVETVRSKVQPEELLNQINALTENGQYSVRFEKDQDNNSFIVKVVDAETKEIVRQIPPEELIELTKTLKELQGNLVDTES